MTAALSASTAPRSVEERVKSAKRAITSTGMRIGRTGAMISTAGVVAVIVSFTAAPDALATPLRLLGAVAAIFGVLPFMLGWKQSKAGSPFLRGLSNPGDIEALLMEEKPMSGDRRSVSVLLGDGTSQSVALPAADAGELFALVQELNPKAQCEVAPGAQRMLAAMKP
jgi:hypothetical protein